MSKSGSGGPADRPKVKYRGMIDEGTPGPAEAGLTQLLNLAEMVRTLVTHDDWRPSSVAKHDKNG